MASFASVLHHGWCTQATRTKRKEKEIGGKVSENNGKLRTHRRRLDQKKEEEKINYPWPKKVEKTPENQPLFVNE